MESLGYIGTLERLVPEGHWKLKRRGKREEEEEEEVVVSSNNELSLSAGRLIASFRQKI